MGRLKIPLETLLKELALLNLTLERWYGKHSFMLDCDGVATNALTEPVHSLPASCVMI